MCIDLLTAIVVWSELLGLFSHENCSFFCFIWKLVGLNNYKYKWNPKTLFSQCFTFSIFYPKLFLFIKMIKCQKYPWTIQKRANLSLVIFLAGKYTNYPNWWKISFLLTVVSMLGKMSYLKWDNFAIPLKFRTSGFDFKYLTKNYVEIMKLVWLF